MPSAHPDLVKMWGGGWYKGENGEPIYFGASEQKATEFLKNRGYILNSNFTWKTPDHIKFYKDIEHEEYDALCFLIDEWDYGYIEPKLKTE